MNLRNRIVKLYALSTCPMCRNVKKRLHEMNVTFELIDVDLLESGEQWVAVKEVKKYNPDETYPTLVCVDVITDFSESNLKEVLRLD